MKQRLDFEKFARMVAEYELQSTKCVTSAHHSNGSGKDWEAFQRQLASEPVVTESREG